MPDEETKEQAKEQADQLLSALADVDWLERDGFYRVTVHFGERDSATLCALCGDAVEPIMGLLPDVLETLPEEDENESVSRILTDATRQLTEGDMGGRVWDAVDRVLAPSLVEWNLPDYEEMRGVDDLTEPNADMEQEARIARLKSLPLPMVARMLGGVFWLTKNL